MPIIEGISSSPARIAICELTPPQAVINPAIECENNQSKPGSALGIQTMEPESDLRLLISATNAVTFF